MIRAFIRACQRRVTRLPVRRAWRSDHGVAGIEMAIILPLAMLVMLGFTELYMYLRTVSAAERVAFTLADTIGQKSSINDVNSTSSADNIGTYWYAANVISRPLDFANRGEVIVSMVCDTASNNCANPDAKGSIGSAGAAALMWQRRTAVAGGNSPNQDSRLQSGLLPTNWPYFSGDSMIAVEVFYRFNPYLMTGAFWSNAPGTIIVYQVVYARPRNGPVTLVTS